MFHPWIELLWFYFFFTRPSSLSSMQIMKNNLKVVKNKIKGKGRGLSGALEP